MSDLPLMIPGAAQDDFPYSFDPYWSGMSFMPRPDYSQMMGLLDHNPTMNPMDIFPSGIDTGLQIMGGGSGPSNGFMGGGANIRYGFPLSPNVTLSPGVSMNGYMGSYDNGMTGRTNVSRGSAEPYVMLRGAWDF